MYHHIFAPVSVPVTPVIQHTDKNSGERSYLAPPPYNDTVCLCLSRNSTGSRHTCRRASAPRARRRPKIHLPKADCTCRWATAGDADSRWGSGLEALKSLRSHPRQSALPSEKARHLGTKGCAAHRPTRMSRIEGTWDGPTTGNRFTVHKMGLKGPLAAII